MLLWRPDIACYVSCLLIFEPTNVAVDFDKLAQEALCSKNMRGSWVRLGKYPNIYVNSFTKLSLKNALSELIVHIHVFSMQKV